MKPASFDYIVAESIEMAVASLAEAGPDAKIIAGGQSLVPMLNFRLLRPSLLVDINRIPGLASIEETETGIRVGALTRPSPPKAGSRRRTRFRCFPGARPAEAPSAS